MKDLLIVIPAYREQHNILILCKKLLSISTTKYRLKILIIDDSDNLITQRLIISSKLKNKIFLIKRSKKSGRGSAVLRGMRFFIEKNNRFSTMVEMDADLSHDPKELIKMYEELNNSKCDVVVGSRYINGINVVNWPLSRIILSYCASIYSRIITGVPIHDLTSGFVGFNKNVLQKIELSNILFNGYAFQIELKFKAYINNYILKEIPIIFKDRRYGKSKMNGSIILEAIFGLIKLKFMSYFYKKK